MSRIVLACACATAVSWGVASAETIIVDPSAFADGADIGNAVDHVTLSTAQGSMVIEFLDVIEPLELTSDLTTPVFAVGGVFAHSAGDIWSAGQCCGGDQVLRADFERPTFSVAVHFLPNDTDTGVLQIYDGRGRLLAEQLARDNVPFTISVNTPNKPIAYALATYGDTGRISTLSFDMPPRPGVE